MTSGAWNGRVAFITGGASGLGLAVGRLLLQSGAKVVLMDLSDAALKAASAGMLVADVLTVVGDVTRPEDCEHAVAEAVRRFGGIDLVWANAGIGGLAPLVHIDAAAWMQTIQVNVFGVLHTVRAALPSVLSRRGQIAVSASAASFGHAPGLSAYAASKAAVEAMCDSWRIELAHHGVTVTCIHPLWVTTPMVERGRDSLAFGRLRKAMAGPLGKETPLAVAATLIADGLQARARRVFVPRWVKWVFALRSLLHLRFAEREQIAAAPDLERLFADDLQRMKAAVVPEGPASGA